MEAMASAAFSAATKELLPKGLAPPPQVFVFNRLGELTKLFVGYVTCRPYRRGGDAAAAIAELGRVAAAISGTDLLVFWEEHDIRTSLYGPSDDHPTGLVLLQVTWESHFLTWFPFDVELVRRLDTRLLPDLDIIQRPPSGPTEGTQLHQPIASLIQLWRTGMALSANLG